MNYRISCVQCKHYFITWNQKETKGCKAFGIKPSALPSKVVWQSSGDVF